MHDNTILNKGKNTKTKIPLGMLVVPNKICYSPDIFSFFQAQHFIDKLNINYNESTTLFYIKGSLVDDKSSLCTFQSLSVIARILQA